MTERWWAPQRATIEPDAVVKAIFDTPGDVATAMLGAHRAGAAACEVVSKGAVPSEVGLVRAMAGARARFAPAMVKSLATATGSGSYAGLLARDVLDAAEVGALDLFRTCVAKGISPPLAAQRAGAVYGVPMRELGQYTSLAIDPRANPVALTDAADRAMLAYFAKIAEAEGNEAISKAGRGAAAPPPPPGQWDPREHPRNSDGEFIEASDRSTRLPLPDVEEAPARAPRERQQRVQRVQRQQRQQRTQASLVPTGRTAPRPPPTRRDPTRRAPQRAPLVRPTYSARELAEANQGTRLYVSTSPKQPLFSNADLMAKPDPENTHDYAVVSDHLVLTGEDIAGRELRAQMPGDNLDFSPKMFRLGYLLNIAGQAEILETDAATGAGEARAKVARDADPGYQDPHARIIAHGIAERERVKDLMSGGDLNERSYIRLSNDYDTGQPILVHWKPSTSNPHDYSRPEPSIDEYVITTGVRGEINMGSYRDRHPQVELDPNQVVRISKEPSQFYDQTRRVMVNRYELEFVDEDEAEEMYESWKARGGKIGKAAGGESQHWRVQPRDEQGQWAEEPDEAEQEAEQPERQRRAQRVQRQQRQQHTQRAEAVRPSLVRPPVQRRPPERQEAQRQAPARRQITQAQRARLNKPAAARDKAMPVLDDRDRYRVYTWREFEHILGDDRGELHAFRPWRITGALHTKLSGWGTMLNGQGVSAKLGDNVERAVLANEGTIYDTWQETRQPLGKGLVTSDADWEELGKRIRHIQEIRPDIAQINVVYGSGYDYQIVGSNKPVEDQIVLEYDDEIDFSKPVVLTPLGRFHSSELWREGPDGEVPLTEIEDQTANAPVRIMRVHNAGVRRFHVGNP